MTVALAREDARTAGAGRRVPREAGRRPAPRRGGTPALRVVGGAGAPLVPLGEVLVPAGRRPVLRLLPAPPEPDPYPVEPPVLRPAARPAAGSPARAARLAARPAGAGRPTGVAQTAVRPAPRRAAPPAPPARRAAAVRARRLALLVALAVAGGVLLATRAPAPASAGDEPVLRTVVVEQGQTLWSIARETAPREDPRAVVHLLQAVNGLDGGGLAVGQRLVVPTAP